MKSHNRLLSRIGLIIFVFLLISLFLSKTIYSYYLPVVQMEKPAKGKLEYKESAKGIIESTDKNSMFSEVEGQISHIYVKKGDVVNVGDKIASLSMDMNQSKEKAEDIALSIEEINLQLDSIEQQKKHILRDIEREKGIEREIENNSQIEIGELEEKIKQAFKEITEKEFLYQSDVITRKEWEESIDKHTSLERDMTALLEKKAMDSAEFEKKQLLTDTQRKTTIENYHEEIEKLEKQQEAQILQKEKLLTQAKRMERDIAIKEVQTDILASQSGQISDILVEVGAFIPAYTKIAESISLEHLQVSLAFSKDSSSLTLFDEVYIENADKKGLGTISSLTKEEDKTTAMVDINKGDFKIGDMVTVSTQKVSERSFVTVSNQAIQKDKDGYFVFVVDTREGLLGEEYFISKKTIRVGESDDSKTAVLEGLLFLEPVVVDIKGKVVAGQTVLVSNEGDLYE